MRYVNQVRVRYNDTDRMSFVYHANYAMYFEVSRLEMLRARGLTYKKMEEEGGVMLPGKWGILPVVLAGMIAFSRLYLGVHYPGDVLAGFLVALLTSTVACRLMRRTFSPQKS